MRFSDPGFVDNDRVGLFYNYVGAPAGVKKLEIIWDESDAPTQVITLDDGEVQRDDDARYDYEGIVEHVYRGLTRPVEKVVRINFLCKGQPGKCSTVRRVTDPRPGAEARHRSAITSVEHFGTWQCGRRAGANVRPAWFGLLVDRGRGRAERLPTFI